MTTVQATDSPAAAGTRILLETAFATWRFAAIKGLLDIGAFKQLAEGPLSVGELAARCGADAEILRRVLRCVAALNPRPEVSQAASVSPFHPLQAGAQRDCGSKRGKHSGAPVPLPQSRTNYPDPHDF